jgi:hypothetical protein
MNRQSITPAALLFTTALALAGCTGTPAPSTAGTSSAAAAAADQPSAAADSPAAGPSAMPAAAPKAYAAPELAGIIAELKDAGGQPLTAVPAEQLDQGIATARQMMASAVISPAECGVLADNSAQIPEGSTYAAGGSQSATEKAITVLTLVAVTDPELLTKGVETSLENSTKCSTFTMEIQGQRITSRTEVLDVETAGDQSFSSLATQTLPSGQTMTTVMVMGIKGTLSASAVATGAGLTEAASADLTRLVDEALAKG